MRRCILLVPFRVLFKAENVETSLGSRDVDPHSFFADSNPAIFINADPHLDFKKVRCDFFYTAFTV